MPMHTVRPRAAIAHATIAIVACFAVGVAGLSFASASPATTAQLSSARAKLQAVLTTVKAATADRDRIERDLSKLLASVDGSRRRIEGITARLVNVQLQERGMQAQLDARRTLLDRRAAEAYMDPGYSIEVILGSSSFDDLESRLAFLDAVSRSDQALVAELSDQADAIDRVRSQLDALERQRQASQSKLDAQARTLATKLTEQEAVVARLNREVVQGRALVSRLQDRLGVQVLDQAGGPPGPPAPPGAVQRQGPDRARLHTARIAQGDPGALRRYHESSYEPTAVNPSSGAAGVFQFMPQIWPPMSQAAGWGGASVFDAIANVAVAAWAVGRYGWSPWRADAALRNL